MILTCLFLRALSRHFDLAFKSCHVLRTFAATFHPPALIAMAFLMLPRPPKHTLSRHVNFPSYGLKAPWRQGPCALFDVSLAPSTVWFRAALKYWVKVTNEAIHWMLTLSQGFASLYSNRFLYLSIMGVLSNRLDLCACN